MDYKEKVIALLNSQELSKEQKEKLENIFPELKESDDDRIVRCLLNYFNHVRYNGLDLKGTDVDEVIAWLEKQEECSWKPTEEQFEALDYAYNSCPDTERGNYYEGVLADLIADLRKLYEKQDENNPTDKAESKFKVGDWIVDNETPNNVFCVIKVLEEIYKVIDTDGDDYHIPHCKINKQFHLWTIADAKDGDVLVNDSNIFIFHFINDTRLMGYCHVNIDDGRFYDDLGKNECFCLIDAVVNPATKEQRDLLFQKMKEAGYEWDSEKKELKKIESKTLDADNVIYVKRFKEDFELC